MPIKVKLLLAVGALCFVTILGTKMLIDTDFACQVSSLGAVGAHKRVYDKIRVRSEGEVDVIDFRKLAEDWDSICAVENSDSDLEFDSKILAIGPQLSGGRACWGWTQDRATFVIASRRHGIHSFLRLDFKPSFGKVISDANREGCSDMTKAIARCSRFDASHRKELRCLF